MRRLIASAIVALLLATVCAPLALATTAVPAHACCLRKQNHHCGGSVSVPATPGDLNVSAVGSCCTPPVRALSGANDLGSNLQRHVVIAPRDPHPFLTEFESVLTSDDAPATNQDRAPPASRQ